MGVLTALAVPSFLSVTTTNGLAADTNDLVASLRQAQTQAITRGANVTVCAAAQFTTVSQAYEIPLTGFRSIDVPVDTE